MKKYLSLSLTVLLLLGAIGCSKANSETVPKEVTKGSKETVIRYPNTPWYDSVYIADAKGYFAEEGIKIEYVGQLPAGQIVPSVTGKSIDFGLRHTPLVALARAQGAPLKIVAAGTETLIDYPHMRYIVKKDSDIKDITDIVGKKVAINSFGACSEFVTKEFLKINNIEGEIDFVVLPDAQQEQSLEQGTIDLAIIHSPYSKKATENPALKELTNDYAMENGISGMCPYFTHEDFIKENPEAVKGFVTAVSKASEWAKENEEEAKKIIAEKLGIEVSQVEPWAYYENQVVQKEAAQWWVSYLEDNGKLQPGQLKVEDLYTNEFNAGAAEGGK
jgi:ABC-type nitrate/sulfonate/bicarbonate transport system substrate-binding protein